MGLGAEPVQPADSVFPSAAHARAALLVRPGDAALRAGALAERVPFPGRHAGHERPVHGVEHIEVRQRQSHLCLALADGDALGGLDGPDDHDPRQLWRAQDEARACRYRWFCCGLCEGDGWKRRVQCAIDDCPRGRGECYVVRDWAVL
jgi:hypothetical protein